MLIFNIFFVSLYFQELQAARLVSDDPIEPTEEECALAAQFRMQCETVMKALRPGDLLSAAEVSVPGVFQGD